MKWFAGFAMAAMAAFGAHAEGLYKVIGADGSVTYTDRAPDTARSAPAKITALTPSGVTATARPLPEPLRQAAARWPVTLYTSADCTPCDEARRLLRERGVPHAEKTARTPEDREAWIPTVGGPEAPALKVGAQTLRGLQTDRWHEYLDAAGYPRTSKLPVGYQFAEAEPLAPKRVEAARTPAAPQPALPPAETPGGIRF